MSADDHYNMIKPITFIRTMDALMMRPDCDANKRARLMQAKSEFIVSWLLNTCTMHAPCLPALWLRVQLLAAQ